MTPQELKNSILQLAIQGKLVEQRPEEGTAEELLKQIQAEKQVLIKAGKIKKEKPLPEIAEDEKTFDIPESWKWVRIGKISESNIGLTYKPSDIVESGGTLVLRSSNIQNNTMVYYDNVFVSCPVPESSRIHRGDLLICARNGSRSLVGKCAIVDRDGCAFGAFMAKICSPFVPYIKIFLDSPIFRSQLDGVKTETINQITQSNLKKQIIPLPPLAEQKRIVAKIEELLPLIDRYEEAWTKLEEFNKRFPGDMQKSLLQMAIQGKLVEQRPEEGTGDELYNQIQAEKQAFIKSGKIKKDKPLPEIADDEKPFDIPDSWKWVRLGNIILIQSGEGLTSSQMIKGNIPVYGGNGITGYHNQSFIHEETVVIGRVGFYCGSVHITEKEAWVTDNAFITTYPQEHIYREYLVHILRHMNLGQNNNATAQPVVSGKKIYPMLFPLPPLAEQKRIVAKLEQLLPLCERLK